MTTDHMELRRAAEFMPGTIEFGSIVISRIALAELLAAYDALLAGAVSKRGKGEYPAEFLEAYDAMKAAGVKWREGSTPAAAFKQWQARIKAGADAEQVLAGTMRYAAYMKATGAEVKMAQTFFGLGEHYTAEWAVTRAEPRRTLPDRRTQQQMASDEALARLAGVLLFDPNVIDMETSHGSR